jgi:hypothetical protein
VRIGTEQQAAEAYGPASAAGDFLRRPISGPVTLTPAADALAAEAERAGRFAVSWGPYIEFPGPPGAWSNLVVSIDPQREPRVECTLEGAPLPLEQSADGIWRPRPTETNG